MQFTVVAAFSITVTFSFSFFGDYQWVAYAIYATGTVLACLVLVKTLPETKNKTISDVEAEVLK